MHLLTVFDKKCCLPAYSVDYIVSLHNLEHLSDPVGNRVPDCASMCSRM